MIMEAHSRESAIRLLQAARKQLLDLETSLRLDRVTEREVRERSKLVVGRLMVLTTMAGAFERFHR